MGVVLLCFSCTDSLTSYYLIIHPFSSRTIQIIANRSLATPLRELKRLVKLRLAEIRDTVGFNQAALRTIAKVANDRKNSYFVPNNDGQNIWAGLGLGSDVAAALEGK